MMNTTNSIIAIVISALVNAVYVLIMSGTSLIESKNKAIGLLAVGGTSSLIIISCEISIKFPQASITL